MSKVVWALFVIVLLVGAVSCTTNDHHKKKKAATRERELSITDEQLSIHLEDDPFNGVRIDDELTDDEEDEEEERGLRTAVTEEADDEEVEDELDGLPDDKKERVKELSKRIKKSSDGIVKLYPQITTALHAKKVMLERALQIQADAIAQLRRDGKGADLREHLEKLAGIGKAAALMRDFFSAVKSAKESKGAAKRNVPEEVLAASKKEDRGLQETSDGFHDLVEQVSGQLDILNAHSKGKSKEFSDLSQRLKMDSDGLLETQRAVERECDQLRISLNNAQQEGRLLLERAFQDDAELPKKKVVQQVLDLENQRNKLRSDIASLRGAVTELQGEANKIRETVSSLRVTVQSLSEAREHRSEEVSGIHSYDEALQRELVESATQLQARVNQLEFQRKKFQPVIATSRGSGVSSIANPWSPCSVIGCCTAER